MISFDTESLQRIGTFEKFTRVNVKDHFIYKEKLWFIVDHGQVQKALGKQASTLKKLEGLFNRNIKIVEFNPNASQYLANVLKPLKIKDISQEDGLIIVQGADMQTNGLIIGAKAQNLRFWETLVQKFFPDVKEIKVI